MKEIGKLRNTAVASDQALQGALRVECGETALQEGDGKATHVSYSPYSHIHFSRQQFHPYSCSGQQPQRHP